MRPIHLLAAAAIVVPVLGGCSYDHDNHGGYDHHPRHAVLLDEGCGPYGPPPPDVVHYRYEGRHRHDVDRYHRG
jgi:hypothetical protein